MAHPKVRSISRTGFQRPSLLLVGYSPITKHQPANNQEEGECHMRPGIEILTGSRCVMGRESRVKGGHHRHQARVNHPTDGIGVRIARVQESQQEPSGGTGSQRAHSHMAPKSR